MPRRSPVKLVCKQPFRDVGDDMKVCKWTCPRPGAAVQFRYRKRRDWFAILHRSTREPGKWQVTSFDAEGPVGDVVRTSCETALYDAGINRDWSIEKIDDVAVRRARALAGRKRRR